MMSALNMSFMLIPIQPEDTGFMLRWGNKSQPRGDNSIDKYRSRFFAHPTFFHPELLRNDWVLSYFKEQSILALNDNITLGFKA